MIEVQNLTRRYGDRVAVEDLSFSVEKGEALGFLGPNGAGKTTTMKMITGCLCPHSGSVRVEGRDTLEDPLFTKSKMGYLPETPPIYEDMYVEDYLLYVGKIKNAIPGDLPSLVKGAMEKTGLMEVKKRLISNLSKGFKQRVGLAQALIPHPQALILDEPTVGLDPVQVIEIRELICELKKDHTIILSSHILSEVEVNCERIVIISEGRIAKEGLLKDLKQNMKARRLRLKIKQPSQTLQESLKSLEGVSRVENTGEGYLVLIEKEMNEEIARLLIDKKAGLLEIKEEGASLEELFVNITRSENKTLENNKKGSL